MFLVIVCWKYVVFFLFYRVSQLKDNLDFRLLNWLEARKNYGNFEFELNTFCIMIWPQAYGNQGVECDALNENGSHRLKYFKAWSPVSGIVWEGLGGLALWEEVCHCGVGFEVSKAHATPS